MMVDLIAAYLIIGAILTAVFVYFTRDVFGCTIRDLRVVGVIRSILIWPYLVFLIVMNG
mgnify:CR=1 FL=1